MARVSGGGGVGETKVKNLKQAQGPGENAKGWGLFQSQDPEIMISTEVESPWIYQLSHPGGVEIILNQRQSVSLNGQRGFR